MERSSDSGTYALTFGYTFCGLGTCVHVCTFRYSMLDSRIEEFQRIHQNINLVSTITKVQWNSNIFVLAMVLSGERVTHGSIDFSLVCGFEGNNV